MAVRVQQVNFVSFLNFDGETRDTGVCHVASFRDPDGNALMLHRRYAPFEDGREA